MEVEVVLAHSIAVILVAAAILAATAILAVVAPPMEATVKNKRRVRESNPCRRCEREAILGGSFMTASTHVYAGSTCFRWSICNQQSTQCRLQHRDRMVCALTPDATLILNDTQVVSGGVYQE